TQARLALIYDPSAFRVSASDVHLGAVPLSGSGWEVESVIDPATGQIGIVLYSATPIAASISGSLVTIGLHATGKPADDTAPVRLAASVEPAGHAAIHTALYDVDGPLTLHTDIAGAPTNSSIDSGVVLTASVQGLTGNTPSTGESPWNGAVMPVVPGEAL